MLKGIYAIKDELTEFFNPIICANDDDALRTFSTIVNDKNSTIGLSPKDYSIWKIGEYNSMTGEIYNNYPEEPTLIVRADAVKRKEN